MSEKKANVINRLLTRNNIWGAIFILLLLCFSSWLIYYSSQDKNRKVEEIAGVVLTGVACSLLATYLSKIIMLESLKNEIFRDHHIDLMKTSLLGLSVDGVILDPKTNYEFAIRMIKDALESGKVITEGNMTSDEYFFGNSEHKNFNVEISNIIRKMAKTKKGKEKLRRYYKIYKSMEIENKRDVNWLERQESFKATIKAWRDQGVQIQEYERLCTDFLLISDHKGNPEQALVGVFFDEDYNNTDRGQNFGWLALHITSGKPLEKIDRLATGYSQCAFKESTTAISR